MTKELRERAFKLYRAPFRFEHGYVWDAKNEMVADDYVEGAIPVGRIRGWGRVSYLPEPQELQDAVGELMAEALTKLWRDHFAAGPTPAPSKGTPAPTTKAGGRET